MYNKLKNLLEEMSASELITIHNNYCDEVNGWDNHIYEMDELNEVLCDTKPDEIANLIFYGGGFNPNDGYFIFDGYGNLESFNEYAVIDNVFISDIVRHIIERDDDLSNDDIRDMLDSEENENDA